MSVGHIHHRATKALRPEPSHCVDECAYGVYAAMKATREMVDNIELEDRFEKMSHTGRYEVDPRDPRATKAHKVTRPSNSAWGIEKLQKRGLTGLTEWEHTHVVNRPDEPRFRMFSKRLEGNFSKFVDGPDTRKFTTTHGHAFDSHPMSGSMPHEAPSIAAPIVLTHAARKKLPQHTSTASPVKY